MRSVVIFALFALAVCRSPLDIVSGFTNQLALTDAQTADVNNCVSGLFQELQGLAPIYRDYLNRDLESLIVDGAAYLENFEGAVEAACQPVLVDLYTYAVTFGNGQELERNLEVNGAYVAQQVALLVQSAYAQNFTAIGQTVGYLYQLAVGSVDLPSLLPQQLTQQQAVTIFQNYQKLSTNEDDALTDYLQAYIDELGLTEQVNTTALVDLTLQAPDAERAVENFIDALHTGDFDSDIDTIEDFVTQALEFVRANKEGFEAIVTIDAPYYEGLVRNPLGYIARAVYNVLLNAPKIEGFDAQLQQDLLAGDFTAAGEDTGDLVNSVY